MNFLKTCSFTSFSHLILLQPPMHEEAYKVLPQKTRQIHFLALYLWIWWQRLFSSEAMYSDWKDQETHRVCGERGEGRKRQRHMQSWGVTRWTGPGQKRCEKPNTMDRLLRKDTKFKDAKSNTDLEIESRQCPQAANTEIGRALPSTDIWPLLWQSTIGELLSKVWVGVGGVGEKGPSGSVC